MSLDDAIDQTMKAGIPAPPLTSCVYGEFPYHLEMSEVHLTWNTAYATGVALKRKEKKAKEKEMSAGLSRANPEPRKGTRGNIIPC